MRLINQAASPEGRVLSGFWPVNLSSAQMCFSAELGKNCFQRKGCLEELGSSKGNSKTEGLSGHTVIIGLTLRLSLPDLRIYETFIHQSTKYSHSVTVLPEEPDL